MGELSACCGDSKRLNTGVNANWLLTGQGDMFNAASSAVEPGMQEVWAVYQRLGDKERALLLEVARVFAGTGLQ